jgi:hypothetical protein
MIQYQLQQVNEVSLATYFTCKLITPANTEGNIKILKSSATGRRWQVTTACFLPVEKWKAGIRMYGVAPMQSDTDIKIGDILLAEPTDE